MRLKFGSVTGCALIALASPVLANEGMWMPRQTGEIGAAMREDGLQLDPEALGRLDEIGRASCRERV